MYMDIVHTGGAFEVALCYDTRLHVFYFIHMYRKYLKHSHP